MRIVCWIPKATKTHSEYVILIPFPLQQRFALTRLNVTLKRTLPVLLKLRRRVYCAVRTESSNIIQVVVIK
jgi:hypothetical protein